MTKIPPELDLDFLPPRAAALFRVGHKKTYLAQKAILLFVSCFIVWAYFAQLHEVTKGTGKIIPSSRIQTINNLEGGIIKDILVQDGYLVEKGQVLARLDTTISKAKYRQDLENYHRFLAASERLHAQVKGQDVFTPSLYLQNRAPQIVAQEIQRFQSIQLKKQNDTVIAESDLEEKKQELRETEAKISGLKKQYKMVEEQLDITRPLVNEKIYSRIDYLKLQRDITDQKSQQDVLQVTRRRQLASVKQSQQRLEQIHIRYRNDDLQELREVESKLAESRGAETADWDRVTRTEIRAPLKGIIRDIKITTVGGVVQPGESIMDLVPVEDTLLVEAQIAPADVGFLHTGMPATVKLTAYDSSTYGGLEGFLEDISPDTITDKREQNYYRILVRTKTSSLVKNGKILTVLPGMQVEVDILTGKKSVLAYIGKPFIKALKNSLTEK